MIVLGYILTFGWVFAVLGLTQLIKRKTRSSDELSRKIVHISVAFAWIPMYLCFGYTRHLAVAPAVFIVLNAVSYHRNLFSAMERSDESKKSLGTVYYALSMTVMSIWCLVWGQGLPAYGCGLFCMALGDGLAPWFGALQPGNKRLFASRTLYGSLCIFVVSLAVLAAFSAIFALQLGLGQILLTAAAAVVLELVGVKGFDNLTLPLGVFLLVFLFTM